MSDIDTFNELANELCAKAGGLGKMGIRMKFVFNGLGSVHIDASGETPEVTVNADKPADFTISANLNVWLDLRAKKIAPHVAAMTRKIAFEGDLIRGMQMAPAIMKVL